MGEVFSRAVAVFARHFPALALFTVVIFLPLGIWEVMAAGKAWGAPAEIVVGSGYRVPLSFWARFTQANGMVGQFIDLIVPLVLQATVTLGVFQFLGGHRVDYARSFRRGMARFFPVLGVALITALVLLLAMIVVIALLGTLFAMTIGGVGAGSLMVIVGTLVMLAVLTLFFVGPQVAVVEGVGPARAMARSAWLTQGVRWQVFGILFVFGAIGFFGTVLVQRGIWSAPTSRAAATTAVVVTLAWAALVSMLQAVTAVVVYHDLRKEKEG
ncbi:MAG: hypothetical protein ACC662_01820, partial [Planctomycetota bacterium]